MALLRLDDYIWDFEGAKSSELVPESEMKVEQFRASCGFSTNPETKERVYYVPQELV